MAEIKYEITEEKRQLFDVLKEMIIIFGDYCKKHDVKWFVGGGTMLGAIRHKGFIPWDDDVDVGMLREDYDRLVEAIKKDPISAPYYFQSSEWEEGFSRGFIRLMKCDTTAISIGDIPLKCRKGIWIDILPLDKAIDNQKKLIKQEKQLKFIYNLMKCVARNYSGYGVSDQSGLRKIFYFCTVPLIKLKVLTMKKLYKKLDNVQKKYQDKDLNKVAVLAHDKEVGGKRVLYNICDISEQVYVPFEDITVPVPKGYDNFLRLSYGDYMTPRQLPTEHGDTFFDFNAPYDKYIEQNKEKFDKMWRESKTKSNR